MQQIKISIPEPCHEKWEDMTPTERGAFCHNCKKDIIDFTDITTFELNDYLNKNKTLSCGRFTRQQLDAVYVINTDKPTRKWFYKSWATAVVSFFIGIFQPRAEAKNNAPKIEWTDNSVADYVLPVVTDEPTDSSDIIISGVVLDEKGEPLTGAIVMLDEQLKIGAATGLDGKFKIIVPVDLKQNKLSLTFKLLGFQPTKVDLGVLHKPLKSLEVVLKEQVLGEFMGIVIFNQGNGPKAQADRFYFGVR